MRLEHETKAVTNDEIRGVDMARLPGLLEADEAMILDQAKRVLADFPARPIPTWKSKTPLDSFVSFDSDPNLKMQEVLLTPEEEIEMQRQYEEIYRCSAEDLPRELEKALAHQTLFEYLESGRQEDRENSELLQISDPRFPLIPRIDKFHSDVESVDHWLLMKWRAFSSLLEIAMAVAPSALRDNQLLIERISTAPWRKDSPFYTAVTVEPAILQTELGARILRSIPMHDATGPSLLLGALKKFDSTKQDSNKAACDVIAAGFMILKTKVPRSSELSTKSLFELFLEQGYVGAISYKTFENSIGELRKIQL